jgi:hypothetical protein
MTNIYSLLPKLTLNGRFVQGFLDAPEPCCAVGVIEERKQVLPLLALRPGVTLPDHITAHGFEFGHSVLGDNDYEIVRFSFEFRGFATYHVLLNPNDPAVCEILRRMVELRSYFIIAIDPDQHVTAFRADVGEAILTGLIDHLPRLIRSTTSGALYDKVLAQFRRRPEPPGHVLEWVCHGDLSYLDLTKDRMELSPTPMPESNDRVALNSMQ